MEQAALVLLAVLLGQLARSLALRRRRRAFFARRLAPRLAELCGGELVEPAAVGHDKRRWRLDLARMELTGSYELDAILFETRWRVARTADRTWYGRMLGPDAAPDPPALPPDDAPEADREVAEQRFRQAQERCWTRLGGPLGFWLGGRHEQALAFFARYPGLYPGIKADQYAAGRYDTRAVWQPPRHAADAEIQASAAIVDRLYADYKRLTPYAAETAERHAEAIERTFTKIMLRQAVGPAEAETVDLPREDFDVFNAFYAAVMPHIEGPAFADASSALYRAHKAFFNLLAGQRQRRDPLVTIDREELRVLFGFYFEVRQLVKAVMAEQSVRTLRAVYERYKLLLVRLAEPLDPEIRAFFRYSVRPPLAERDGS